METEKTTEMQPVTSASLMPQQFGQKLQMAKVLCNSGLMPQGLNTPEKIAVSLQWGHELGLTPMVAVNNIAVVNGRPTLSTDIMAALARKSPEYAGLKWICQDAKRAEVVVMRKGAGYVEEYRGIFTIEEAANAGLVNKDNWKKYPSRMLAKRALAFAIKDAFPDLLAGIYQVEEVEQQEIVNIPDEPIQLNEYQEEPKQPKQLAKEVVKDDVIPEEIY